jgi:hypothetical protein
MVRARHGASCERENAKLRIAMNNASSRRRKSRAECMQEFFM